MKTKIQAGLKRVSVFVDHSNILHSLIKLRKVDPHWVRWYDPLKLAQKLAGNRELVSINFYCAPPPYLLQGTKSDQNKYWKQLSYYDAIKKLPDIKFSLARITGMKNDLHEKNLDTQLNTDLIMMGYENKYDTAIIVANDGDYVAAIEGAKKIGRKIELAYFKGHCSMDSRKVCDVPRKLRQSYFEELAFTVNNDII